MPDGSALCERAALHCSASSPFPLLADALMDAASTGDIFESGNVVKIDLDRWLYDSGRLWMIHVVEVFQVF